MHMRNCKLSFYKFNCIHSNNNYVHGCKPYGQVETNNLNMYVLPKCVRSMNKTLEVFRIFFIWLVEDDEKHLYACIRCFKMC